MTCFDSVLVAAAAPDSGGTGAPQSVVATVVGAVVAWLRVEIAFAADSVSAAAVVGKSGLVLGFVFERVEVVVSFELAAPFEWVASEPGAGAEAASALDQVASAVVAFAVATVAASGFASVAASEAAFASASVSASASASGLATSAAGTEIRVEVSLAVTRYLVPVAVTGADGGAGAFEKFGFGWPAAVEIEVADEVVAG